MTEIEKANIAKNFRNMLETKMSDKNYISNMIYPSLSNIIKPIIFKDNINIQSFVKSVMVQQLFYFTTITC